MSKHSKSNLLFFESSSMRELYDCLLSWQGTNQQRLLSLNIQYDNEKFCCIAIVDPLIRSLTKYEEDMARFQRKALNNVGSSVDFINSSIPPEKILRIQSKLANCQTPEEVKAVFAEEA